MPFVAEVAAGAIYFGLVSPGNPRDLCALFAEAQTAPHEDQIIVYFSQLHEGTP